MREAGVFSTLSPHSSGLSATRKVVSDVSALSDVGSVEESELCWTLR